MGVATHKFAVIDDASQEEAGVNELAELVTDLSLVVEVGGEVGHDLGAEAHHSVLLDFRIL